MFLGQSAGEINFLPEKNLCSISAAILPQKSQKRPIMDFLGNQPTRCIYATTSPIDCWYRKNRKN